MSLKRDRRKHENLSTPPGTKARGGLTGQRIAYLVTEDWYFVSHRLDLAMATVEGGAEALFLGQVNNHGETIRGVGITTEHLDIRRSSLNPVDDIRALYRLLRIVQHTKPTLLHAVAMKPVLYAFVVGRLTGLPVVNLLPGLGFIFSSEDRRARQLRRTIQPLLKLAMNRAKTITIVQNPDDYQTLRHLGVRPEKLELIKGSGVDVETYNVDPSCWDADELPVIALAARLTAEKGVRHFVEAARLVRQHHQGARFVLVGKPDPQNPASIGETELHSWVNEGVVEWWGFRDDMHNVWNNVNLACLPSTYGEGVPKSLLEASACGLPIVTTDSPGCRETVVQGETGFLVRPGDSLDLAEKISFLLRNPERARQMGAAGRARVLKEFSNETIIGAVHALYLRALADV